LRGYLGRAVDYYHAALAAKKNKENACDSAHWVFAVGPECRLGRCARPEIDRETPRATMESLVAGGAA